MKKFLGVILILASSVPGFIGLMMFIGLCDLGFTFGTVVIWLLFVAFWLGMLCPGITLVRSKSKSNPGQPEEPSFAPAPQGAARLQSVPTSAELSDIKDALLALNSDENPFQIIESQEDGADLVAEWKIVDAKWRSIFGKVGMTETFKIFMKLDYTNRIVRSLDRQYRVDWSVGLPSISRSVSMKRGQVFERRREVAFGLKEDGGVGKVVDIDFSTGRMKKPIRKIIADHGWKFKGVWFGKL